MGNPTDDFDGDIDGSNMDIAIVGMAGRFPGAADVERYWRNIRDGVESIVEFTDEQLRERGIAPDLIADSNYVKAGVVFEGVDQFDPGFFGYSPRDAEYLDPQHRIFLECVWEALESAGYNPQACPGSVGIYAGAGTSLYLMKHLLPAHSLDETSNIADLLGLVGSNSADSLCTRVAYKLNLRGPAVTVQTACSTSLMAVHTACQSLLAYECDVALAGGVSLNLLQQGGYRYQPDAIFSPDGHCRPFDARAAGTVLGSGAGVVVLKRLDEALRDGDTIWAVIKGSAANNDGADKVGFTAPGVKGQTAAIRAAQLVAGISAETIGYVEAHGTGTVLGDPIEVSALTAAFRSSTQKRGFCALGSVKGNIGHLDAAAGIAGLIKACLALKHQTLPASLHFESPNPAIDFDNSPFYITPVSKPWPAAGHPRRAGISSFGIGGTNVHVVLEESPETLVNDPVEWMALPLSAPSGNRLKGGIDKLGAYLQQHPDAPLKDVAYTLANGRKHYDYRAVFFTRRSADGQLLKEVYDPDLPAMKRPVAFLFPGQGAQHAGMAHTLYQTEAVFRETFDRCCDLLLPLMGVDLRGLLYGGKSDADEQLAQTANAQPALFAVEYAMAQLWISKGIQPDILLGHSVGEYVAACLAGTFSLADALAIIARRGQLLQATQPGAMLAVHVPEAEVQPWLARGCDLAAVNAHGLCVLSGTLPVIEQVERELQHAGINSRRLVVSRAFHSALTEPVLADFRRVLAQVNFAAPQLPWVSNLTGKQVTASEACSADYWVQHLRGTVRFADGLETVLATPDIVLLEVGPGETLAGLARRHPHVNRAKVLGSQAHPARKEVIPQSFRQCMGQLWALGYVLDWSTFYGEGKRKRIPLPTAFFERQSYWVATPGQHAPANVTALSKPVDEWFYVPGWKRGEPFVVTAASVSQTPVLLFTEQEAGSHFYEALRAHGYSVIRVERGAGFRQLGGDHYQVRPNSDEDFQQLVDSIPEIPTCICHLWGCTSLWEENSSQATDEDLLCSTFHSLIALVRTLELRGTAKDTRLLLVANQLERVLGTETLSPVKAALLGLAAVIPQEYPNLRSQVIDLAQEQEITADLALQLVVELQRDATVPLVAYRGNYRWLKTYDPVKRDAQAKQDLPAKQNLAANTRLRQDGVYLITGGLGGIGLKLAAHLVDQWGAAIALVGRSPLPPRHEWEALIANADPLADRLTQLLAWESRGIKWLALTADVADPARMRQVIEQVISHFGGLHGVIHAAGEAGDGLISQSTPLSAAPAFIPKIQGTRVLFDVLAERRLDFIALFSSLAAVAGGMGKSAYAAANAVMDSMAYACNGQRATPVFSIAWDGWRNTGMAANVHMPDAVGIESEQGLMAFERIINGPPTPHTLVCSTALDLRLGSLENLLAAMANTAPAHNKHGRPMSAGDYVEPCGEIAISLAAIWSDLLGIAPIGAADNLLEMGGDSLLMIQLAAAIRSRMGIDIPLKVLFEHPVLEAQATLLSGHELETVVRPEFLLEAAPDREKLPLSYAQQRLWFLWKLEPATTAFNIAVAFHAAGDINPGAIRVAFRQLAARHAMLRTRFVEESGQAWQQVLPEISLDIPLLELDDDNQWQRHLDDYILQQSRQSFDLAHGALFRPELIRCPDNTHIILLVMHHIVTDGRTIDVMMQEFAQSYSSSVAGHILRLPLLPYQYADFAWSQRKWLEAGEMSRQAAYWKSCLQGISPLVIPPDLPLPPVRQYPGNTCAFSIDHELAGTIREVAGKYSATPFMLLLGSLGVVFSVWSGQGIFHIGTDMANRQHPGTDAMVGFFVNQVAIPLDCDNPETAQQQLEQVRQQIIGATDCQDLPFDRLVETLRVGKRGGRAPLFQIKVVYQEDRAQAFNLQGLTATEYPITAAEAELDLVVSFLAGKEGIRVYFKYDAELYSAATIEAIRDAFLATLAQVTANANTSLTALKTSIAEQRRQSHATQLNTRSGQLAQLRANLKPRRETTSTSS